MAFGFPHFSLDRVEWFKRMLDEAEDSLQKRRGVKRAGEEGIEEDEARDREIDLEGKAKRLQSGKFLIP